MNRIICHNCGVQAYPDPIKISGGAWPLEAMVAEDDDIRQKQYEAAMIGADYQHSLNIAANHPNTEVLL
jgi:hypothetical protein